MRDRDLESHKNGQERFGLILACFISVAVASAVMVESCQAERGTNSDTATTVPTLSPTPTATIEVRQTGKPSQQFSLISTLDR